MNKLFSIFLQMNVVLSLHGHLNPTDPSVHPVLIVGQKDNLSQVSYDTLKVKLQPKVSEEVSLFCCRGFIFYILKYIQSIRTHRPDWSRVQIIFSDILVMVHILSWQCLRFLSSLKLSFLCNLKEIYFVVYFWHWNFCVQK